MPIIPDYKPAGGSFQPSAPSVGAATAAGNALQKVGNAIGGAADEAGAYHLRLQNAQDNGVRNQSRLLMQQAMTEHQQYRLENPDESTWEMDMSERASKARAALETEKMSPFLKVELDAEFNGWNSTNAGKVKYDATRQGIARARQRATNAAAAYEAAGDFESARKVREASRGAEFLPEEVDADQADADQREQLYRQKEADRMERDAIATDPASWLAVNPADQIPPGADAYEYRARRSYALQVQGSQQAEIQDLGREAILSGAIRTEAEIDHITEDALPSVRARLKGELAAMNDSAEKLRRLTPEYQNRVAGEISSAMLAFDPDDVESRLALDAQINTLPTGATKNHFREELSRAIKGEAAAPDSALGINLKLADSAFEDNFFGRVVHRRSIASVLNDGYLEDTRPGSFMMKAGLTPEEAKEVAAGKDDLERKRLFSSLWSERKLAPDSTNFVKATAQALRDGRGNTQMIEHRNDANYRKALDLYGKVKSETIRWAKQNPDAGVDEIRNHMLKIAAPGAADEFIDAAFNAEADAMSEAFPGESLLPPLNQAAPLDPLIPNFDQ